MWEWTKRWGTLPWEIQGVLKAYGHKARVLPLSSVEATGKYQACVCLVFTEGYPHWVTVGDLDGTRVVFDSLLAEAYSPDKLLDYYRWGYLATVV